MPSGELSFELWSTILFAGLEDTLRFLTADEAFLASRVFEVILFLLLLLRGIFFPLTMMKEPDFFGFAFKEIFKMKVRLFFLDLTILWNFG